MSGETGKNEATNNPTEGEIVQQGSNVEATKRVVVSNLERKCGKCGKKFLMPLLQARRAQAGKLVSRCCRFRIIPVDRKDMRQAMRQEASKRRKLDARIDALPVTEAMVKAVLKGFGFLERTKPRTISDGRKKYKALAGWKVTEKERMGGIFIICHGCRSLGQAYMESRRLAGVSTDIGIVEKELRGEQ